MTLYTPVRRSQPMSPFQHLTYIVFTLFVILLFFPGFNVRRRASIRSTTLVGVQMTSEPSELGTSRGKVAPMTAHCLPAQSGVRERESISLCSASRELFTSCYLIPGDHCLS